ncbi:MAG: tRNA uridine-5-carboxymethylaminomethyl(34) synthesis GTPase MnmE [Bacteroidales bacterium]|jgi:tRNA modification GTPase|nr:tRNA uridine-5-carboxymethylaminomethyl(34) synthesis GTPase MnmE [Bacteroidales bacterium]MBQ2398131.1 tRNA uridine-5-carboxymethylaminomethyl(34) synthesis GTPase MnmE [Bacteroidales bacterium]MBQ5891126.1 tRNA uridine-5-carboxymethylaminomethyl(34) synthesis GTPase MnmE [Bacteroidales bacterium]MED9962860.1 tRNA uridine-5-carboxymethylaminomethyl(34) synthesis GTPase MnmE [Bacteroidales bacterium]MEE0266413.1 tRNA uridine-5-carboxymethylaminomethyl(34) synthesis GTPase MnmE [Bacteroidales
MESNKIKQLETICAPATANGTSAIGIIRVTGEKAIEIVREVFRTFKGKKTELYFSIKPKVKIGYIIDSNKNIIDEVVCLIYRAPRSYTGENLVEIQHHGSIFIQQEIIKILIEKGARMAKNGEFSQRAFLNGKMNLAQTEAVADLISSRTAIAHHIALTQLKGGYQQTLKILRKDLLDLLTLLELELDFSEEDVEFAQRKSLQTSMEKINEILTTLINSFDMGNAFKNGIPIAIIGKPNAGKSTLFNAIINDERAIVSPISGTTRDTIEEIVNINGIEYRFIDTAGVRKSEDPIEAEGIKRSYKSIESANIIIYVCDVNDMNSSDAQLDLINIDKETSLKGKKIIIVANKCDGNLSLKEIKKWQKIGAVKTIAKDKEGVDEIIKRITIISESSICNSDILMTNARHYEAMKNSQTALQTAKENLINGSPTDIVAIDIRESLHYLGEITGEVTTEELLGNVFSKFCIGK